MRDFTASIDKIRENDQKATISASSIAENVGAVLTNDNVISYIGDGYERVLLHHYQSLNYLKQKDLEGAGVEVRRANMEQEEALKRFAKDVENAQKQVEEKKVDVNNQSAIESKYAEMDEIAGKVKNSFQNAYTFYLSGFIYELINQPNDAYIDYKKALEIYPENNYVQKDVLRLAESLNMSEDLDALRNRFQVGPLKKSNSSSGGELLVLFEDGFAPQKQEIKIPIPIPSVGLVTIAFPIYRGKWNTPAALQVYEQNNLIGPTEPICDIHVLAVKALKEKIPAMAIRQIIRAALKGTSNVAAKKAFGDLGTIGMSVLNFATENADQRSWLTLPSNAQILRTSLSAGVHKIMFQQTDGSQGFADIEIAENSKTVFHVIKTGNQFYTSTTNFTRQSIASSN